MWCIDRESPPVVEHQPAEVFEPWDGNIGEVCSLVSFFAHDSDSDLSSLNHVHIIAAITDGDAEGVWVERCHFADDACLVVWRAPVDYH